jgi:hypothetical protein
MKTVQFKHDPKTGYLKSKRLRPIPSSLKDSMGSGTLFSFRSFEKGRPDLIINKLNAVKRPTKVFDKGAYYFYGIQSDTPLAPLLLWDAVHYLNVGETITIEEDSPLECYLEREYFRDSLQCLEKTQNSWVFKKTKSLPAESSTDMDSWTFGIPVGPEDATILNAVVKRILELDIPNKEILLCGMPGSNFAYFDQVRIVGEDITAPPVQICKKKNRLAQEAKYDNLCILHDRVFLPKHFGEMVRRFGGCFPLMTLQSLFFDNRLNLHPRRYSDYGFAENDIALGIKGLPRNSHIAEKIAPSTFTEVEKSGFRFASAMRYHKDRSYPTGSMYICNKAVWLKYSLDESLHWVEYEDIEHGIRCSQSGIPTRINPYGITQSITSRALLGGISLGETSKGEQAKSHPAFFSLLPKKPLLKLSTDTALTKVQQFAAKYVSPEADVHIPTGLKKVSPSQWIVVLDTVVQSASFKNDLNSIRQFITDFEKLILMDQLQDTVKELMMIAFLENPLEAKKNLIFTSSGLFNMLQQRPLQSWFYNDLDEYFHCESLTYFGTAISSLRLYFQKDKVFYFESFLDTIKAIHNSTPFCSYIRSVK